MGVGKTGREIGLELVSQTEAEARCVRWGESEKHR